MDATASGAASLAGRETVSKGFRAYDTAPTASSHGFGCEHTPAPKAQRGRARTNKSCGPDARGLCVKSCGDVAARPGARISHLHGDGGNSASLPRESTKDTLKPSRREGRAIRRTCGPPRVHFYRARTCGCQPAPRLLCALVTTRVMRSGKARAKHAAGSRTLVRCLKRVSVRRLVLPHSRCRRPA